MQNVMPATVIDAGSKVLGLDDQNNTVLFPLSLLTYNNLGTFQEADPAPPAALLNQSYQLIGTGVSATPSGTYTNLPGVNNAPLVIPAAAAGTQIINARALWNGNFWVALYDVVSITSTTDNVIAGNTTALSSNALINYLATNPLSWIKMADLITTVTGKNMLNPAAADVSLGYYIYANGSLLANASYNTSGFIQITAGSTYTFNPVKYYAWYDANKVFISYGAPAAVGAASVAAPANAEYVRVTMVALSGWAAAQVEAGSAATAYAAYSKYDVLQNANGYPLANGLTAAGLAALLPLIYAGLVVSNANLAAGAVSHDKANFFTPGKNKFNPNDSGNAIGYYVDNTSGNALANASYNLTGYLPVTPGLQYSVSYKHNIAWYNALKVYISGDPSTDTNKTQTAPAGAAYVRCTVAVASWSVFQFEQAAAPTIFEAYNLQLVSPDGIPITLPGVTLTVAALNALAETNRVKSPQFAIAPKLYVAKGQEIGIYYETIAKYIDEYNGKIDIALTGADVSGRACKITPAAIGTLAAAITVYDEKFDTLLTIPVSIIVTDPAINDSVNIINIGDSYTLRSGFVNKLLRSAGASGVTFLGLRNTTTNTTDSVIKNEGRGGSSLSTYFTQDYSLNGNTGIYNPFMQPANTYLYYGRTDFWINANSATPNYDAGQYNVAGLFSASTGFKLAPNINDLMYDAVNAAYKYWNGTAWAPTSAPAFAFSFAKYRTAWNIAQPNIVHVLFGTNDWSNVSETQIAAQWPAWMANMNAFIASVQADSPNAKIIIGIPNAPGKIGREGGAAFYEKRKRAYWCHASQVIANFTGLEASKIYVLDYNAVSDREYGFANIAVKPFADYSGTDTERELADAVHLGPDGFLQIGNTYLGLIQAIR